MPVYMLNWPLTDVTVGYSSLDILLPLRKGCEHYKVETNTKVGSFE